MTALLELRNVVKRFVRPIDAIERAANLLGANHQTQVVHALEDVSLSVRSGEVVGLVGESGSGKSTLGRIAAGLVDPTSGLRLWKGEDPGTLDAHARHRSRLAVQMIFQDPLASLNPRMRVIDLVGEAAVVHGLVSRRRVGDHVAETLARVGLEPSVMSRYPHQFSGGQRARIGIARALAVNPEFLVCDEAVAALDVSVQAQVLNLFIELKRSTGLTYLFISHDLDVVRHMSDRIAVMYLGRVVESGPTVAVHDRPAHPYTQGLLAALPRLEARRTVFAAMPGDPASALAPPPGCAFHPRCPHAMPRCKIDRPVLREIAPDRASACHLDTSR